MAIDREATLKNAEKFLRIGRLDAAIAEYARVVEEFPRDWTTANSLGDLYLRAAQSDKAVALYQGIVDHLLTEGFYPKAGALLKKILKIRPDDEAVQIRLGEISGRQGLLADARAYFSAVAQRRRQRGDTAGADEMLVRIGALDPSDVTARIAAAQALERAGDGQAAARIYRELYDDHIDKDRQEEASAALRELVRCRPDARDPELLLPVVRLALQDGRLDDAKALLPDLLAQGPAARDALVELAWSFSETRSGAAEVCVDALADACVHIGHFADAAAILQEFAARVPGQVSALLRLVEVCVDGRLDAMMYEAQAQLADAYLASGSPDEARVIAEDLVSREPGESAHVDRLRRALQMLNVPDPEAVIAERIAAANLPSPEAIADLSDAADVPMEVATEPPMTVEPIDVPPPAAAAEPSASAPPSDAPEPSDTPLALPGSVEVDLTMLLEDLQGQATPPVAAPAPARDLEDVFAGIRAEASREDTSDDQSGDHVALAQAYLEMGMPDEAFGSLEIAVRSPRHRFTAASLLGRLCRDRGDVQRAVEWYERAAEAPAPDAEHGLALLYELGDLLELLGENARALAVFMEIEADTSGYRDVSDRVTRLSDAETGG